MLDIGKQVAPRHAVASQLISYDHPRHILQALQQPAKEALGGLGIAPILNKDVEDNAVLIDGTPEIVLHPLDPDEHFIHVPLVPGSWPAAAHAIGETLAEFLAPAPHCLIGDHDAPLSQEQLDVTQAEAEHVIQPYSMADELGRKAMAVMRVGWWLHATTFVRLSRAANPGYRDNAVATLAAEDRRPARRPVGERHLPMLVTRPGIRPVMVLDEISGAIPGAIGIGSAAPWSAVSAHGVPNTELRAR